MKNENRALNIASNILHKLDESIDPDQTTVSDILRTKRMVQELMISE